MAANNPLGRNIAIGCMAWLFCVAAGQAQQGSPREVAAQNGQLGEMTQLYAPSAEPTGRDLILLVRHKPIFVDYTFQEVWNQNAFYTPNKQGDFVFSQTLNMGFETKVADTFEVWISGFAGMTRYERFSVLDYDSYGGRASIAYPFGDFRVGADYRPVFYYTRGFDQRFLTLHDLGPYLRYQKSLVKWGGAFGELRLSRIWGDPSSWDAFRVSGTAGAFLTPCPWCLITTGVQAYYTTYDNFYETITSTSRNDTLVSPFASVAFTPAPGCTARLLCRWADNDSTVSSLTYQNLSATAQATFTVRF